MIMYLARLEPWHILSHYVEGTLIFQTAVPNAPVQLDAPQAFPIQDRMETNLLFVKVGRTRLSNHFSQYVLGV